MLLSVVRTGMNLGTSLYGKDMHPTPSIHLTFLCLISITILREDGTRHFTERIVSEPRKTRYFVNRCNSVRYITVALSHYTPRTVLDA